MEERDRVCLAYDKDAHGTVVRVGPSVSLVKFDDGKERAIVNKHLLPLQERHAKANKQTAAQKEDEDMTAPKTKTAASDKLGPATFGLREDTNYARMIECLAKNIGKPVKVEDVAKAAYPSGDQDKAKRRVVTMSRKVQEGVITKKRLPFKIVKEKDEHGTTIGLHAK